MNFDEIYQILQESFADNLYRKKENQRRILDNPKYKIETEEVNGKIIGFIAYWELDGFLYVEHLAVRQDSRNNGLGAKLLQKVLKKDGIVILEVEKPTTDLDKRRIGFYQRNGFMLNGYNYVQPPYNDGDDEEELYIMATEPLEWKEFINAVSQIYSNVYQKRIEDYDIYNKN